MEKLRILALFQLGGRETYFSRLVKLWLKTQAKSTAFKLGPRVIEGLVTRKTACVSMSTWRKAASLSCVRVLGSLVVHTDCCE